MIYVCWEEMEFNCVVNKTLDDKLAAIKFQIIDILNLKQKKQSQF